jgi:hypothetical protein
MEGRDGRVAQHLPPSGMGQKGRDHVGREDEQHEAQNLLHLVIATEGQQKHEDRGERDHEHPPVGVQQEAEGGRPAFQVGGDGHDRHREH